MRKKAKYIIIAVVALVLVICLVPIKKTSNDDKTVQYKAVFYSVTDHDYNPYQVIGGHDDRYIFRNVKILGFTVYDNAPDVLY